jgi:uncharacterized membrane protein YphA (DoxX/SURF4 family)
VYLTDGGSGTFEASLIGLWFLAGGGLLLIGFLTPFASALVAIGIVGIALSWLPRPTLNLFDTPLPAVLAVVDAAVVACIGPGALSVDCRLFGRREIIIPHSSRFPRP